MPGRIYTQYTKGQPPVFFTERMPAGVYALDNRREPVSTLP